ncbi:MAG: hypothetical protein LQ348_000672 [Seirophora lacunosa]|nr:MAG: hypothetical protein LQ348_000672 [Seirophora lacunosa]
MKSRQASPQPELVQLRTWRLNSPAEPPSLQLNGLNGLFQANLGLSSLSSFTLDPVSPPRPTGIASDEAGDMPRPMSPPYDTPSKSSLANSQRFQSQPLSGAIAGEPASPVPPTAPGTPNNEHDSPWSSAVGRATTGKSGRVIERLMADNDRLRREKNLVEVRLEEEAKRSDSARSAMEGLRSTNENLTSIHETDRSLLGKRDRKLEELRLELEAERQRREKAETETKETRRERDEAVGWLKKELVVAKEQAHRATTQYDVMSKSFRGLEDNYGRQVRKLKSEMRLLEEDIAADKRNLASIHTVMEHYRNESQRAQEAKDQLNATFEAYKSEAEQGLKSIREDAERNTAANDRTQDEMQKVLGQMRYVVNVKQNVNSLD